MTKRDIAIGFVILGFILFVVGFGIREKGRLAAKIPDHSHVYTEGGRYYYRHGNPKTNPSVEVTAEQYETYMKANKKSKLPFFTGVFFFMSGGVAYMVLGTKNGNNETVSGITKRGIIKGVRCL